MHWPVVGVREASRFKFEKAAVISGTLESFSAYEGGGEVLEVSSVSL